MLQRIDDIQNGLDNPDETPARVIRFAIGRRNVLHVCRAARRTGSIPALGVLQHHIEMICIGLQRARCL